LFCEYFWPVTTDLVEIDSVTCEEPTAISLMGRPHVHLLYIQEIVTLSDLFHIGLSENLTTPTLCCGSPSLLCVGTIYPDYSNT
jgi:hypothetical protein